MNTATGNSAPEVPLEKQESSAPAEEHLSAASAPSVARTLVQELLEASREAQGTPEVPQGLRFLLKQHALCGEREVMLSWKRVQELAPTSAKLSEVQQRIVNALVAGPIFSERRLYTTEIHEAKALMSRVMASVQYLRDLGLHSTALVSFPWSVDTASCRLSVKVLVSWGKHKKHKKMVRALCFKEYYNTGLALE